MEPEKVLACPRTKVGDRLGRFIVNRLKVRRPAVLPLLVHPTGV